MSELNVYTAYESDDFPDETEFYLKSEADKVIAHHKYKRCLAMALVWLERSENSTDLENELVSRKRCCKWMELAEKFKETK